jgi:site-specific DNA-methyltransferase (adenine-specific)
VELVDPGSVDVVVTSPPYNRKVRYGRYDDDRPRADYLGFLGEVRDALGSALAPQGSLFLNLGSSPTDPYLPWDVARVFEVRFRLQNVIHWVKSIAIDRAFVGRKAGLRGDLAVGHYKPLVSDRFLHGAQEYVFHFSRTGRVPLDRLALGVRYQDGSNTGRWASGGGGRRCRGNTWFLPYDTIRRRSEDRPHPASFPVELPAWCYRLHGLSRIQLAADPFVGIGSSAVAAARLGLPFVGFDVDAAYVKVAERRVAEELAKATAATPRRQPKGPSGLPSSGAFA